MNYLRWIAGMLVLVVLFSAPSLGRCEPPGPPKQQTKDANDPQPRTGNDDGPQLSESSSLQAQPGPAPRAMPAPIDGALGLSFYQWLVLAVVFAVFLCLAVVMRRWLAPRDTEEAETPPTPDEQDVPQ
jgi:hypothetical protein